MTFVHLVWSHELTSQYRPSSHVLGFVECGVALRLSRWPCGVCGRGVGSYSQRLCILYRTLRRYINTVLLLLLLFNTIY